MKIKKNKAEALDLLKKNPVQNAWAIQDLSLWPERCSIFFTECARGLSYLLISGHPSLMRRTTVILSDGGGEIEKLFPHLPSAPYVIRESSSAILPKLHRILPHAKCRMEWRMETDKTSFKPLDTSFSRTIRPEDMLKLADFYKVPPHKMKSFARWFESSVFMAVFSDDKIVSAGASVVRSKKAWILAGLETLPEFRGKGYGGDITSALTGMALKSAPLSLLTVFQDNQQAIRIYQRLGYRVRDESFWMDVK